MYGILACFSPCVWGACISLSLYHHTVYVVGHELCWAALKAWGLCPNFCLHKHTIHMCCVHFVSWSALVKLCYVCCVHYYTAHVPHYCELGNNFVQWAISDFHQTLSPQIFSNDTIMLAFFFNHCRGVFLTSPLLGTLNLSLVTPLSIAYSIVVGKVRSLLVPCYVALCTSDKWAQSI